MPTAPSKDITRRNLRVAVLCAVGLFGMVGASYAAVPLYRAFCQLTGFDGTIRKAEAAPSKILDRKLLIRFDANVRDLPWDFKPSQVTQEVKIGATGLAFYKVTNHGKQAVTGRASYNVVPESAGAYFQKLECFCFNDQTIQPGQSVEFPVVYFVDPQFATDFETKGKTEVTLSYTFFPVESQQAKASEPASPLGGAAKAGL
ncbi:cytochrome c oxidase assembly protein [Caulobacter sp. NIBR1757]|uniref:cytochrome c oxidase assembly protein n=1 Tax=Caulobacter sp. NIBR1757 TaxID=3016000 RepID=UPI0022F0A670|nr:cytochrome c oxidase assembly protein [Caulobacter sp. NIBR1757]WGM37922.1 Cytochrome c oxidase assembly protein CtaG [Caulobacter sp. NIBR1757]